MAPVVCGPAPQLAFQVTIALQPDSDLRRGPDLSSVTISYQIQNEKSNSAHHITLQTTIFNHGLEISKTLSHRTVRAEGVHSTIFGLAQSAFNLPCLAITALRQRRYPPQPPAGSGQLTA